MKYVKKKINLENFTVRNIPSTVIVEDSTGKKVIDTSSPNYYYGTIPNYKIDKNGNFILNSSGQKILNTIDINLFLTQKYDDMGAFSDSPYSASTQTLTNKPSGFNSFTYGRLAGAPPNFYYDQNNTITGYTDSFKLKQVKSYRKDSDGNDIYAINLNTSNDPENLFSGTLLDDNEKTVYKIGANIDNIQNTGIEFTTFKNELTKVENEYGKNLTYNTTIFKTDNGGWNQYNTTLSATTKKEEYLGVVFNPEVDSGVFINRGIADIFERHALLSEIKSTNDIDTNRG